MVVELICVGTELLMGNIVNTNAAYISEKCVGLGLSCFNQQVVGDNAQRLADAIRLAMSRSDIVILSGGLGPTEDDLTKEIASEVCGREMYLHEPSRLAIENYFKNRNIVLTDNNWKQAYIPENGIVLDNPNGTAPGVIIEEGEKRIILLPGPPNELIPMFEDKVVPYFEKLTDSTIYSVTVKETGIGESHAEEMIKDLIDAQTNPTIATYAKTGEVHIRISAKGTTKSEAKKLTTPVVREIKKRFGKHVYTTDEKVSLEMAVVDMLKEKGLTFTCAESCTGGLFSGRMVSAPGASEVYNMGFVTYANKAKRKLLGVSKDTLKEYGAVSKECALEMAVGAADKAKSDVAIAITGIAGPGGGTKDKPVGLVYIACFCMGNIVVEEYRFRGNRTKIRDSAVSHAISLMRNSLLDLDEE